MSLGRNFPGIPFRGAGQFAKGYMSGRGYGSLFGGEMDPKFVGPHRRGYALGEIIGSRNRGQDQRTSTVFDLMQYLLGNGQ